MRPRANRLLPACLLLAIVVVLAPAQEPAQPPPHDPRLADQQLLKENKIPVDAPGLVAFFKNRTANPGDADRIKKLVRQLGADDFEDREDASRQLVALGSRVLEDLQKATRDTDIEIVRRAEDSIRQIKQVSLIAALQAAVRHLARSKDPASLGVLLGYLPTAEQENLTDEVREAIANLAIREGKPEPAIVAALTDKEGIRRGAAGIALVRAKQELPAVRKLLEDPDARVKSAIGLALAGLREKEVLPVLIALLDDPGLTRVELASIEELLYRLGEEKSPAGVGGNDAAARKKFRLAWEAWWKDHGEKIDLAKLEEATRVLGHTTIVLLDQNKVIDLDATNKVRFTVENLAFPLDVQYLPGDRILVAEHNGQKVTERNREGKILWEKEIDSPLAAQRLPNGNTVISTRQTIVEVDARGKEISTYTQPRGEQIMRVQRLRNGQTAVISQLGVTRFALLDANMKEVRSFGIEIRTSGGRIEVLPNGNILVPENSNNRVVEHDTTGRVVWEVAIDQPIAALRLPNGNTLITTMNLELGAVELDREGKQVWQYKAGTRVTRAIRR